MAADELSRGSLAEAERQLAFATRGQASVPAGQRGQYQVVLAVLRLWLARQHGNLPAVAGEVQRLLAPDTAQPGAGGDLRALALINLGIAEFWSLRVEEPIAGIAYLALGAARLWQGRLEDAQRLLAHAERALPAQAEPAAGLLLYGARGGLELARGRDADALRAFQAAEPLAGLLGTPYTLAMRLRASLLHALVRVGETQRAEQALAECRGVRVWAQVGDGKTAR